MDYLRLSSGPFLALLLSQFHLTHSLSPDKCLETSLVLHLSLMVFSIGLAPTIPVGYACLTDLEEEVLIWRQIWMVTGIQAKLEVTSRDQHSLQALLIAYQREGQFLTPSDLPGLELS